MNMVVGLGASLVPRILAITLVGPLLALGVAAAHDQGLKIPGSGWLEPAIASADTDVDDPGNVADLGDHDDGEVGDLDDGAQGDHDDGAQGDHDDGAQGDHDDGDGNTESNTADQS